jgi:hypothetical protein
MELHRPYIPPETPMTLPSTALLLLSSLAIAASAARAEVPSSPPCFDPALAAELEAQTPMLVASADELARHVADEPGSSTRTVYLLTRQLALLERIQRHAQLHGEETCVVSLDRLQRDLAMLRQTYAGYARGNAELEIERLATEPAQAALRDIEAGLERVQATVDGLKWLGGN